MGDENIYQQNLDKNQANFAQLTPLTFLERAASVYPNKNSLIHDDTRYTWSQTYERCGRLASGLTKLGVGAEIPSRLWKPIHRRLLKPILVFP